ncbi:peptide/nickel transport system permease protein [Haloarcula vallismortis]|uniref:Oligopeptide ABC transporter permease n=2 Tax=Haloarcula vallismortis TaxID=28442 RepID=M0JTV6_HALVA|nr:ABC transporter permease [Haloarcula vallismortis]EMA11409.1 oligopeptide ABC transporter permease [Haloarcula vallismortis ATCC 29715]SDW40506.1 peptide/nickel transport system permease protein [Haloarcula vallismortis]
MSLRRFIAVRVAATVPILFGVSVLTFALVHLTPGDPIDQMVALNPQISAAEEAAIRARYGLDGPVWQQYLTWMGNVLQGDLGTVISVDQPVLPYIMARLPETIALGLFGWAIALLIAIPAGIYAAVNKDTLGDDLSRVFALSGISLPNFWLGLMLILVFALWLDLWPVLAPDKPLLSADMLWYLVLPGVTIGTASSATLMRVMRSSMAEELNKEYVTAARAKGLPERTVVLKHVLRNSLISVTTIAAFLTASIFAGAVVVEQVFAWPGLGRAFVGAIVGREVDLIMAITLFTGVTIILANLLADIMYAVLDPRIRYD